VHDKVGEDVEVAVGQRSALGNEGVVVIGDVNMVEVEMGAVVVIGGTVVK